MGLLGETYKPYYKINREERFFSATLFSLLVQNNANLKSFVSYLNSKMEKIEDRIDRLDTDQLDVYFEYAYLRDVWNTLGDDNRRKLISDWLKRSTSSLAKLDFSQLNSKLVGLGKPSERHVQSPATWSISKYAGFFPLTPEGNKEFVALTKLKWCFKIKPDLVIQINSKRVLSIEAKLEYGESSYPSTSADKAVWREKGLQPVKQTDLQALMFKDVLGVKASIFRLVKQKPRSQSHDIPAITWRDAFAKLDLSQAHPFVVKALKAKEMI